MKNFIGKHGHKIIISIEILALVVSISFALTPPIDWPNYLNAWIALYWIFALIRDLREYTNLIFRLRHSMPGLFPGFDKEYQKYVGSFDYFGMKITDMKITDMELRKETWIRFQRPDKKRGWVEITDGHITDSDPCIMNKEDHALLSYLAACVDPDRYGREDRGVVIAHGLEQLRAMMRRDGIPAQVIDEAVR